jgi:hypothetical protein
MSKATYPGMWCAVPQPRIFIGDTRNNFWLLSLLTYMPTYLPDNVPVVTLILAVGLEGVKIWFGFDLLNSLWLATQSSVSLAWHQEAVDFFDARQVLCIISFVIWTFVFFCCKHVSAAMLRLWLLNICIHNYYLYHYFS